ncbi:MAG: hypothetical protein KatS3mg052_2913 [Candidatus Roseilinea sp.]|nr:MAG: hypothetical protein KatS3mg052_2913 [Candidatus Roseilinea sp.]
MDLLNPAAFLFALLAAPIILLYLLRLQRREQIVSSTLLWRQVTMDREANTLWQRLRRHLLLFLQLSTLAFLVFALIRPYMNVPSEVSGRSIVLLDASASMQATDVAPSRFEAARARVRDAINSMGANDQMTLIVVDGAPRALSALTRDKLQLLDALDAARPSLDAANWSAAIALAVATGAGNEDTTTLVVSDGANADDLSLLPGKARFIPIGNRGDNVAISALTLRRTLRGLSAFVRVTNSGPQDDRVLVSLRADGALVDARALDVPAGASAEWTIGNINPNAVVVGARIDEAQRNFLAVDDAAYAVNVGNTTRHALLLTRGNRFLEQALAFLPGLRVTRAAAMPPDAQTYDLYVLDNVTATLPARANALLIGAQSVFTPSGIFSNTDYVRTAPHPIARNVDWRGVSVLDARRGERAELAAPGDREPGRPAGACRRKRRGRFAARGAHHFRPAPERSPVADRVPDPDRQQRGVAGAGARAECAAQRQAGRGGADAGRYAGDAAVWGGSRGRPARLRADGLAGRLHLRRGPGAGRLRCELHQRERIAHRAQSQPASRPRERQRRAGRKPTHIAARVLAWDGRHGAGLAAGGMVGLSTRTADPMARNA